MSVVLFAATCSLLAQTPVPEDLPPLQKTELKKRYLVILALTMKINGMVDHLESTCKGVRSDDGPTLARCAGEQQAIRDVKQRWKELDDPYEHDLKAAIIAKDLFASKGPAPDLAKDPERGELAKLRRDQINARIERIEKAIKLLGHDNPEWEKQRKILYEEQMDQTDELLWNGIDLITLGIAESAKAQAELEAKMASRLADGIDPTLIRTQRERLIQMQKGWAKSPAIGEWIKRLDALETAISNKEYREAIGFFRESLFYQKEAYSEVKKLAGPHSDDREFIYKMSLESANLGASLIEGPVAKAVLPVSIGAKFIEAGLRVKLVYEEEMQLSTINAQSADRQAKKRELIDTKFELLKMAANLDAEILRSKGLK